MLNNRAWLTQMLEKAETLPFFESLGMLKIKEEMLEQDSKTF